MAMPSLATSIQAFAELCARLDDPFCDRGAALAAEGLDDERWIGLVRYWTGTIAHDEGSSSAQFAEAYANVVAAIRATRRAARPASALNAPSLDLDATPTSTQRPIAAPTCLPSCLLPGVGAPRAEALMADVEDETAELRTLPSPVVLPFRPAPSVFALPRSPARAVTEVDAEGDTIEGQPVQEPALPFCARLPMSPYAATTAGRRLMFFDPQTGQRLPFPIWADTPGNDSRSSD